MHHGLLLGRALHHHHQRFEPLALVKRLFFANAHHGTGIRPIRATAQRYLVHDGRAIDQPTDHANISPGEGGVIEDGAVFGFACVQCIEHLVAAGAQGFGSAVEVQTMAAFVLHFGNQNGFAFQAGGAADPVALGQHAHDFAVGVLADLPHQCFAVVLGHPVARLDLAFSVDGFFKVGLFVCVRRGDSGIVQRGIQVQSLCVHVQLQCPRRTGRQSSISISQPIGWLTGCQRKSRLLVLPHELHHLGQSRFHFLFQSERWVNHHDTAFDQT